MKIAYYTTLALAIGTLLFLMGLLYVIYIKNSVYRWMHCELEARPSSDIEKEWYDLSWGGSNPIRVVALASRMATTMEPFYAAKHMTSAFYSQVKHLLKKGHIFQALAFFLEAKKWSQLALWRITTSTKTRPIDFEVLGAPDFLVAKIPLVGMLTKREAMNFLLRAHSMLMKEEYRRVPIDSGIVWSKLYVLTKEEEYRDLVRVAGLTRSNDENQLRRIAGHLGFKTNEELFQFLGI